MVLAIKAFGWRSMYLMTGTLGITLFSLTFFFIKNPIVETDEPKKQLTEEEEDKIFD